MYSAETSARLALFRQKVADGSITDDELKEATALLRQERKTAVENSAKRRKAARAEVRSADDLLRELESL